MKQYLSRTNKLYAGLVLAFPFLVLFSPRIPIIITHARVDELLVLLWLPFAVKHYVQTSNKYQRTYNASYFRAFLFLFVVFVFGLLYGDGEARWSRENLKLVTRPIVIILNILVLRFWIFRANMKRVHLVAGLIAAVTLAGAVGYLAMSSPALADSLKILYAQEIPLYKAYAFDMSSRAMSVFVGYDQASITYAIGIILSLYLFFNYRTSFGKSFSAITTICLFVAIVSSARIGLVSLFFGVLVLLVMNMKGRMLMIASVCCPLFLLSFLLMPFLDFVFPNSETIERFMDAVALLDFNSPLPFWERSYGMNAVIQQQVYGILYPHGSEVVFGFGDNGEFVSDIGYVTVFVKYGIVGLLSVFYTLITIGKTGFKTGKNAMLSVTKKGVGFPINAILPGLMTLFIVGSSKGGLYFITYKTGELFAFVLALCILEGEVVFASRVSCKQGSSADPTDIIPCVKRI